MQQRKHNYSKDIYREKMHLAIENFKQAERDGAEKLVPNTYSWAKQKIYADKKILLHYPDDEVKIEEATNDASAAAAQLLSAVHKKIIEEKLPDPTPEQQEQEAITALMNEGGPAL